MVYILFVWVKFQPTVFLSIHIRSNVFQLQFSIFNNKKKICWFRCDHAFYDFEMLNNYDWNHCKLQIFRLNWNMIRVWPLIFLFLYEVISSITIIGRKLKLGILEPFLKKVLFALLTSFICALMLTPFEHKWLILHI